MRSLSSLPHKINALERRLLTNTVENLMMTTMVRCACACAAHTAHTHAHTKQAAKKIHCGFPKKSSTLFLCLGFCCCFASHKWSLLSLASRASLKEYVRVRAAHVTHTFLSVQEMRVRFVFFSVVSVNDVCASFDLTRAPAVGAPPQSRARALVHLKQCLPLGFGERASRRETCVHARSEYRRRPPPRHDSSA